jgi:small-conductance mechanosensitive channel
MVNYAILVLGFFMGIALLGFDLTRLTILVGAFGVGLGFGLQNIINNFVSGLILLFERPIKVGDVIQLAGNEGVVRRIGIRASILRVPNGSEVIVPNGSLISDTVTNWTFSDRLRRIDLPVSVAAPAEAHRVIELLQGAAVTQPRVMKNPPPLALLGSFAGDAMNFELRVWTDQSEDWSRIRSDLALAVRATLTEHSIAVK